MTGDLVCVDGAMVRFGDRFPPDTLLAANFVYQKVAVFGRRTAAAEWAAEIAGGSYKVLYGHAAGITGGIIEREAAALLDANGYPAECGAIVAIYLIPNDADVPVRLLSCERQLVWRDYSVSTGGRAAVVPCDAPFVGHRTAASLAAQTCATAYARRLGFSSALCENGSGALVTLGDSPVFAAASGRIFTAPPDPAADSVERRIGIEVCESAGLYVSESAVTATDLPDIEELFALTPQGIESIREVGGNARALSHSLANNLLAHLKNRRCSGM